MICKKCLREFAEKFAATDYGKRVQECLTEREKELGAIALDVMPSCACFTKKECQLTHGE